MKIRHYGPLSAPFVPEVAAIVGAAALVGVIDWLELDSFAICSGVLVFMVVVAVLGGGWKRLRAEHSASLLSWSDLEKGTWASGDFVQLKGRVRAVSELTDPVFGMPCCWFRVTFWRRTSWAETKDEEEFSVGMVEDQVDFVIESGPSGTQVRVVLDEPTTSGLERKTPERLFPDGLNLPSLSLRIRGRLLARAELVRSGDCVTAIGTLRKSDDVPVLHTVWLRVDT